MSIPHAVCSILAALIVTGQCDDKRLATAVGCVLNIDEVVAELLPEQKSAYVGELVDAGRIVAMVGDGVNDAPALTRATVGVAMGVGR